MKKVLQLTLFAFLALGFTSCKDKKNPEIEFITPQENIHKTPGQSLPFQVEITDDRALESYDFYVGDEAGNAVSGFSSNEESSIESREKRINLKLETYIPDTLGAFYMYVKAIDKSGKSTTNSRRFYVDP